MEPHQKNPTVAAVSLADLSNDKRLILSSLKVRPDQEDLGGTFHASLKEWERSDEELVLGLAFLKEDDPVGFVLLKRPTLSPDWVAADAVSLHGLKIAENYQGQGLGRVAFKLAIDAAMTRWPTANQLVLAVDAGNEPALAVYRSFGMIDSGPVFKGRIGLEHRLKLSFDKDGSEAKPFTRAGNK